MTVEMFEDFYQVQVSMEQELKNKKVGRNDVKYNDECFVCFRPMKTTGTESGYWVHLSFKSGTIMNIEQANTEEGEKQSQGFFPVGSDCARKIPKRFLYKAGKK